ncbi:MAG: Clp protease ClpP [Christensenellales bacterium]
MSKPNRIPAANGNCYALSLAKNGKTAEITMYGTIVRQQPKSWWTGKPIEGNFIILNDLLEDLKKLEGVEHLTIRLDSLGGDAYASITIVNRLRELKCKKTIQVDGVAMSGGAMILCSASNPGDKVRINPGSLVMIHKCISLLLGYYNADNLRDQANSQDAMDKAQVAIFKEKCGLDDEELMTMMSRETTLTGAEAVDKGFADELIENAQTVELAASADRSVLFVNGVPNFMHGMTIPDNIPVSPAAQAADDIQTPQEDQNKGGNQVMARNLEELRTENPELAESIMAEARAAVAAEGDTAATTAVQAERQRLAEIDEISALYSADIVQAAKYGDNACSAQEMAFRAAKEAAKNGQDFLGNLKADNKASGAQAVGSAPAPSDDAPLTPEQRMAKGKEAALALAGKKKED